MINPLFAKLFGSMLENKISKWAEARDKHAKGQAGFRPKNSTVDHGITLRHIIEKFWEKMKKSFITEKTWLRFFIYLFIYFYFILFYFIFYR